VNAPKWDSRIDMAFDEYYFRKRNAVIPIVNDKPLSLLISRCQYISSRG